MCVWLRVFWEEALKTVGCEPTVAEYTRLTGILLVGLGPQLPQCGVWCVCCVWCLSFVCCCSLVENKNSSQVLAQSYQEYVVKSRAKIATLQRGSK